ncbi:MAG TPA: glycerate kinase [Woeseiaceae bacterium]|nr:glycerate kinase [Woeseiaceae bacterium]
MEPRALLQAMFAAAIDAARPARCLPEYLPPERDRPLVVLGAGKASAEMARVVEAHWRGPLRGLVVTRYGHAVPCDRIEVVEAGHPVPDEAGVRATARILAMADALTAGDTVLCLLSGGGSALLTAPADGVTLAEKQALSKALLACGATISEINRVRRHLSRVKGGRLAARCHPAKTIALMISDVPGDAPGDIASGPTVGDATTCEDALRALSRYRIEVPDAVREVLASGRGESVKPCDPRLAGVENRVVATAGQSLEAAAAVARARGVTPYVLGDAIEGEAREVGRAMAGTARAAALSGRPVAPPCVLLSGGETTVTVRGDGVGGRNVEFLLALGLALEGSDGVYALAGDTDGIDGQGDLAGAVWTPDSLARATAVGLDARAALENNDAHSFFSALGDSVATGPTRTNVNDFRAILVTGR